MFTYEQASRRLDATWVSFMMRTGAAPQLVRAIALNDTEQEELDAFVKSSVGNDDFHWIRCPVLDEHRQMTHVELPSEVYVAARTAKVYANPDHTSRVQFNCVFRDRATAEAEIHSELGYTEEHPFTVIAYPIGTRFVQL